MPIDLAPYLATWQLTPDGAVIDTAQARLMPVRRGGAPFMLKLALTREEIAGFDALIWWQGQGAVEILERDGAAILMARAAPHPKLADLARDGQDGHATEILCRIATRLHHQEHRPPPPSAARLEHWFQDLHPAADQHGGIFAKAQAELAALLSENPARILLHGDLHHENTLFFGADWAVIDAKGLIGPAELDYAVLFANPDLSDPNRKVALLPGGAALRLAQIIAISGHEPRQILRWLLAWSALSASWFMQDDPPDPARLDIVLSLAEWAEAQLRL